MFGCWTDSIERSSEAQERSMFYLHPALIWAIALCCLCALLYFCTFAFYLKGVKGSIKQMISLVPMADLSPKLHSTAVSVFVIDVESGRNQERHVYNKSATLNLDALAKEGFMSLGETDADLLEKTDSLTNLLVCDGKN
ncbi:uncharacterized protein LOC109423261 [Aedes albopictus]|uniref:Uncharacterized protein n=1 Tax=Aedes albopictus TaxID=7160 RepID=A0ABM1Y3V5_AEDAL